VLLTVAVIGPAHALKGEVRLEIRTDDPEGRLAPGTTIPTEPAPPGPLSLRAASPLDPIFQRGLNPPSPERLTPSSLSTRAASKSDRSLGSPTLATSSVRRRSLCNPLLLWENFNVPESSLGIHSRNFFRFLEAGYPLFLRGLMALILGVF